MPVLPISLIEMVDAPIPYLIGISHEALSAIPKETLSELTLIHLDLNTVITPQPDQTSSASSTALDLLLASNPITDINLTTNAPSNHVEPDSVVFPPEEALVLSHTLAALLTAKQIHRVQRQANMILYKKKLRLYHQRKKKHSSDNKETTR